ncbi:hypothetical protein ES703_103049 [subsurface metagenome]
MSVTCLPNSMLSIRVLPSVSKSPISSPEALSLKSTCSGPSQGSPSAKNTRNPPASIVTPSGILHLVGSLRSSVRYIPPRSRGIGLALYSSNQSGNSLGSHGSSSVSSLDAINSLITSGQALWSQFSAKRAKSYMSTPPRPSMSAQLKSEQLPGGCSHCPARISRSL